jgi:hypothetical protein
MKRLPSPTDPKLLLRREDGGWRAYAELPDLTSLQERLPHLYDELRTSRARIAGVDGKLLATGRLTYPGQEVRFTSWPRREAPFIQLERGSASANALIASQCVISPGPWWLFRRRPGAPAPEVKGKFIRPDHSYCLIGETQTAPPALPWIEEVVIQVDGIRAFELTVPAAISDAETAALTAAGLSVLADVSVRPVGLVASAWDGEGAAAGASRRLRSQITSAASSRRPPDAAAQSQWHRDGHQAIGRALSGRRLRVAAGRHSGTEVRLWTELGGLRREAAGTDREDAQRDSRPDAVNEARRVVAALVRPHHPAEIEADNVFKV